MYYCCPCCRKNKIEFIPITQPNYVSPNSLTYPLNQPNNIQPLYNPNVPLQILSNDTN